MYGLNHTKTVKWITILSYCEYSFHARVQIHPPPPRFVFAIPRPHNYSALALTERRSLTERKPCHLPPFSLAPLSASMPPRSPSRSIWPTACPASPSSACPRRRLRRARIGFAPPCSTPASNFPPGVSPSTWLRRTCPRRVAVSIFPSPLASLPPPGRFRPTPFLALNSSVN